MPDAAAARSALLSSHRFSETQKSLAEAISSHNQTHIDIGQLKLCNAAPQFLPLSVGRPVNALGGVSVGLLHPSLSLLRRQRVLGAL